MGGTDFGKIAFNRIRKVTMMNLLMQAEAAGEASGGGLPLSVTAVYVIGFIAAITIGSIAWYNSKRPPGWEEAERPNWMPEVKNKQQQESDKEE